jgi:hypothetical protein
MCWPMDIRRLLVGLILMYSFLKFFWAVDLADLQHFGKWKVLKIYNVVAGMILENVVTNWSPNKLFRW